jgi:hypothetical protein
MKLEKLLTIINKSTSKEKLIEAFQLALVIILETEKGNQESFNDINYKYEEIINRINTDTSIQELRDKLNEEITNLQNSISNIQLLKGDKGDKGESIKGDKGDNYILTPEDKKEIASSIEVPVVERVIEKTEIIKEQPIVKEVAIYEDRKEIIDKINKGGSEKIDSKQIKGFDDLEKRIDGKHFPVMGGGTPVSISHNGTLKDKEVRNINFTGDVITSVTQNNGTVTVDIDDLSETDPLWTADKPNYLTSSTATSTYVPYTGANADVDLGEYSITASHFVSTSDYIKLYNQTGVEFYSDEGETFFGSIDLSEPGIYNFSNDIGGSVNLDFSGLTDTRVFTFPDHTGNILVDGADIDLGDNSLTVHGLTANDGIYSLADIDLVGAGSLRFMDADGITMYSEICVGGDNMISLGGNGSVNYALLDLSGLTGDGDRTFTFPDHTGTFLVDGADVDLGAFGLTTNDITISSLTNPYIPYAGTAGLLSNSGLYWDNTNRSLGIGTTAPAAQLHLVKADSSGATDFLINPTVKSSGNLIDAQVGSVSKFKVDNTGKMILPSGATHDTEITSTSIKIGQPSGTGYGYIKSDGKFGMQLYWNTTGANCGVAFARSEFLPTVTNVMDLGWGVGNYKWKDLWLSGIVNAAGAGNNYFAGNVGIGTTAPDKQLEINSATGDCLRLTYNDANGSATAYVDLLTTSGGDLTITPSGGDIVMGTGTIRASASSYRRYYHVPLTSANPGASGATWVSPDANTTGGWNMTSATHLLNGETDVHSDWDGASNPKLECRFAVNVDNTGGSASDTVDLKVIFYYKGLGDTATKTQTVEVPVTVGTCARYTQFKATFDLDYDLVGNVLDAGDIVAFTLNLETDTSEVDNIILSDMSFSYLKTHVGIENGDE